jgi:hypothetical protein
VAIVPEQQGKIRSRFLFEDLLHKVNDLRDLNEVKEDESYRTNNSVL